MNTKTRASEGRVAVVYFHGMGSQRRFEETSRLVDRLDTFLDVAYSRGARLGQLRWIRARSERGSDADRPDVTFIRATHLQEWKNFDGPRTHAQFYEAYWADEMREARSTRAVIKWILRQIWRPITMLWTPWQERQRLRRAFLIELHEHSESWPEGTLETDFKVLLKLYKDFDDRDWMQRVEELRAKGETINGNFAGFLRMIADKNDLKPGRMKRLKKLARAWWWRYVRHEIGSLVLMASLLLAILLIVLVLAVGALSVLTWAPLLLDWVGLAADVTPPDWAKATWGNALALSFGALLAVGLRSFLIHHLADVEAWSTYAETDEKFRKREAVLKKSVDLLSHVVKQPDCERVVIVAHSLGTSVAYDTLLAAVHANRAVNPQEDHPMTGRVDFGKISHFVTLASPIDKVSYFFESFRSPIRRYRKIYDDLRGDIGAAPFTKSRGLRQPQIHWVNIWDRADIISGPLQSPAAIEWTDARVDNMHVNSLSYFNPGAAHGAYFDNYTVIETLFDIIFYNRGNYNSANLVPKFTPTGRRNGLDYRAEDFGPGYGRNTWAKTWLAVVAAPWAWLMYLIARYGDWEGLMSSTFWLAVVLSAVPLVGVLRRIGSETGLTAPLKRLNRRGSAD